MCFADGAVMPSGGPSCFQRNLKTWISVLIVVQFCLVLLYLDVTQRDNSPKHLRLQSRVTLDQSRIEPEHTSHATWPYPQSHGGLVTKSPDEHNDVIVDSRHPHVVKGNTHRIYSNSDNRPHYVLKFNDNSAKTSHRHKRLDLTDKDTQKRSRGRRRQHNQDEKIKGSVGLQGNLSSILRRSLQRAKKKLVASEPDGTLGKVTYVRLHQQNRQAEKQGLQPKGKVRTHVLQHQVKLSSTEHGQERDQSRSAGQAFNKQQDLKFQPVELSFNHRHANPLEIVGHEDHKSEHKKPYSFPSTLDMTIHNLDLKPTIASRYVNMMRKPAVGWGNQPLPSAKYNNTTLHNRSNRTIPGHINETSPSMPAKGHSALNLDLSKPYVFHLPEPDSTDKYFKMHTTSKITTKNVDGVTYSSNNPKCFLEGTPENLGNNSSTYGCLCKRGYHGKHCSIPDLVYYSSGSRFVDLLTVRNTSRRIINAITFNIEFELLEARLYELDDVVDVFIVLESNFSNYAGEPKPMRLYQRLIKGYLKRFHHKLFYLFLDTFPEEGKNDGWLVDQNMRHFIGSEGLRRVVNKKPDDIFIYTDADELPSREALLFLKLHDGYPEPFGFTLRWSVFGFFWRQLEPTRVYAGCTIAMMRYVFQYDAYQLRSGDYYTRHQPLIQAYTQTGGHVYDWHLGEVGVNAGWHCSWCMPPERIKIKLQSAINADFPRWGDFPEKLKVDYIRNLIKTGTWFDDTTRFGELVDAESDSYYAPSYLLEHDDIYKKLLVLDEAIKGQ